MGRRLQRQILLILGLSVGVFAVCAWPAYAWGGLLGLGALGTAAGICFLGALVGSIVGHLLTRLDTAEDAGPRAVQAATGVRMLLTLLLSMPILFMKPFPQIQFVVWLAANYLIQMALEVFVSLRHLGQNAAASEGVGSPTSSAERSNGTTPDGTTPDATTQHDASPRDSQAGPLTGPEGSAQE